MARQRAHGGAPTLATLTDESVAGSPSSGGGFGNAPTLSPNPINSGERSVGAASAAGAVFPNTYGGGKSIAVHQPTRRASGTSAGGATGATPSNPGTLP